MPPPIVPTPEFSGPIVYLVLANRQKYVSLKAFMPGTEFDALVFTITQQPLHGQLLGTPPNLLYVPNTGFVGQDVAFYQATDGTTVVQTELRLVVTQTYVPPLGIPAPEFGIAESHTMYANATFNFGNGPEPYRTGANGPFTHYVDGSIGSDLNNPFGTAASPRKTIPFELPAGSVVELHGSGFTIFDPNRITGEGTPTQPIFIRGVDPLHKPVFRHGLKIEANYVICENLEFDCRDFATSTTPGAWFDVRGTIGLFNNFNGAAPVQQVVPYHHICFRHSLIHDCPPNAAFGCAGIAFQLQVADPLADNATDLVHHCVVYDVEVRNISVWNDFSDSTDFIGCAFAANVRFMWVLDSSLHHIHADAISVSRANALPNQAPAQDIYVGRCDLHSCKENGIDVKLGLNCIFSQNNIHTMRVSASSNGDAVPIHNDDPTDAFPYSDNIWVVFNAIYDAEIGVSHNNGTGMLSPAADSRAYVIGNFFHDIKVIRGSPVGQGVAVSNGEQSQTRIVNNDIVNCDQGIWLGLLGLANPDRCVGIVRNNVVIDISSRFNGVHILVAAPELVPFTTIDHDLHFQHSGPLRFNVIQPNTSDGIFLSVADLIAATGFGIGSIQADPLLTIAGNIDPQVVQGSPIIGAGVSDTAYDLFPTIFPSTIMFHFDGTQIQPNQFSIGAI